MVNDTNIINSFNKVKQDMQTLYSHIQYLHGKVSVLEQQLQTAQKPKAFVASRQGKKVHTQECLFAKNIKPERKLNFASKEIAQAQGFSACLCVL